MKIVTWNVNSLAVRLPRVLEFLDLHSPDVVCLQETKCEAAAFPTDALTAAGYASVEYSGGQWAGVAILARSDRSLVAGARGLPGELQTEEARWVEASVDGVVIASAYVPNGRAVGSPTFDEKLGFFDAMAARVGELRVAGQQIVVTGDLNVTREDRDVWDPAAFVGSTHVTPDERGRLEAILEAGDLVDAYRQVHPDDQQFTWWDYRQGHFHRGMGLRIDYILLGRSLAGAVERCGIERDFRKGAKPSDHAPLVVVLGDAA